jgi:ankyrin repeat protein
MDNANLLSSRFCHRATPRRAVLMLVALALSCLASCGRKDVVSDQIHNTTTNLMPVGAPATTTTKAEATIHDAARDGDLERVRALLKSDPDLVSSKDKEYGATPLHWAAGKGHEDVAELLFASKADVNSKDKHGGTPLHWAAFNGHKGMVGLLLASKAEVNAMDIQGVTPLFLAAAYGHKDVVEMLLAKGGQVNAKDKNGMTPLAGAVRKGYKDVAELLRQHGGEE